MTDDILAQVDAVLTGVTDGPWEVESEPDFMSSETNYWLREIEDYRGYRNNVQCGTDKALAEFIAWARTGVPALAAELKAARAKLGVLAPVIELLKERADINEPLAIELLQLLQVEPYSTWPREEVRPARNEEWLEVLRVDPAEFFRRTRRQLP